MSDSDQDNEAIEFFLELADKTGVAVASVKDGYLLMFKRSQLQEIIDKNQNAEKVMIFVRQPKFQN